MKTPIVAALALALSPLIASTAQATNFCVDSTLQMTNALAAAATNGFNDRIMVRSVSIVAAAGGFICQASRSLGAQRRYLRHFFRGGCGSGVGGMLRRACHDPSSGIARF